MYNYLCLSYYFRVELQEVVNQKCLDVLSNYVDGYKAITGRSDGNIIHTTYIRTYYNCKIHIASYEGNC